ncbi:MAG: hypothetical protein JSS37_00060 [Proteobacteria bacterium]|nr:hypothetical protein [Pseudomonadota bacterium]
MIATALEALKAHNQFILYKLQPSSTRPGKTDKLPCDYRTGKIVSAHDPQYWTDSNAVIAAAARFGSGYSIGFVLTPECKLFCLDIDNCLQPDIPDWSPLAKELCSMLPGAAVEISQSGKGLHIWGTYTDDMPHHASKNVEHGIELYTEKRFIALGKPEGAIGNASTDCALMLDCIIALYFVPNVIQADDETCPEWCGTVDDDELIGRALRSKSPASIFGSKASFADLWNGNSEALGRSYPAEGRPYDASSADMALAQHLAFWTGKDCERIERLMRRSALARDKWDSHSSYLSRTIRTAVSRQDAVLTKEKSPSTPVVELHDFYAYLPAHNYIYRPTGDSWPDRSVNGALKGLKPDGMSPSAWLDKYRAVHQTTWHPEYGEIIADVVIGHSGLTPHAGNRVFNRYRPPILKQSDAYPARWIEHVRRIYPTDADHIIAWCAHRVQRPGEKLNHALVLGGSQGIGKDTLLAPVRYAVGSNNWADINPAQLSAQFNPFVEAVVLCINEARDLGEFNRYEFYEHSKAYIAAPPDTHQCNQKHAKAYPVFNLMGVIITTNHKTAGIYLPADDRRHYVAWSDARKEEFEPDYFTGIWNWLDEGGYDAVANYLQNLVDLSLFDAKAPPTKTDAWRAIVESNVDPDGVAIADALADENGIRMPIGTVDEIIAAIESSKNFELASTLRERKNRRKIPHLLGLAGYEQCRNPATLDGRWWISGKNETFYADRSLTPAERIALVRERQR